MEYRDLIRFVPAGKDTGESYENQNTASGCLTGEEAKSFYENIVGASSDGNTVTGGIVEDNVRSCRRCHGNRQKRRSKQRSSCSYDGGINQSQREIDGVAVVKQESDDTYVHQYTEEFELGTSKSQALYYDPLCQRRHLKMLSFVQNGSLCDLKKMFKSGKSADGVDIDFQDEYGWTALMCAAVARHRDIITFLLSHGANRFILNNRGQNVLELCEEAGAIDEKSVISTFNTHHQDTVPQWQEKEIFSCSVCKMEFQECSRREHESSTVHLFNLRLKPKSDLYLVPESNKGFQLMRKSGWNGEAGLGPEGQGRKFPIKTTLKRNRVCLGGEEKSKAKVTHFGPKDTEAVKSVHTRGERVMSAKTVSKLQKKRKEQQDRQWERNLRTYMNTDF